MTRGVSSIAPRQKWPARPRGLLRGMLFSIGLHVGLALLFVLVWHLLPLPPMKPIRISILPGAPTRSEVGLTPDGRLPEKDETRLHETGRDDYDSSR